MKAIKNEFPNPVLADGRDDYVEECYFYSVLEEENISVDESNITIPVKYSLVCNGLNKLLEEEKALVVINVVSTAASYSKLFKFKMGEKAMEISVPKYSVVGKIDLTCSVVAACNIDKFVCPGEFNELYFGTSTFEIRKGDILATEDSRTIFVDDSELERPIASIFSISRKDDQEHDVVPIFDDEKIEICLKRELYDLYYSFKDFNNGALRRYATGIIVYPVLVEAIGYVMAYYQSDASEDNALSYNEKRWFRAIEKKAELKGINFAEGTDYATTIANDILGDIALDALKSFKDTLDNEMNSGETQMIGGID